MKAIALVVMLTGCASVGTPSVYLGHDCKGREATVHFTEYESMTPAWDCARLAAEFGVDPVSVAMLAMSLPVACTVGDGKGRHAVVVMPGAPVALKHYEYQHLTGHRSLPLLPFYLGDGC